jgi:hypothetical protein
MQDEKKELITFNDLPQSAKTEIDTNISYYSLGLIGVINSGKPTEKISFTGSGSLVTFGGMHYILTAGHVVSALKKYGCDALGFNISRSTIGFRIEVNALNNCFIWNKSPGGNGPDLGLIPLPPDRLGWFKSMKIFWNIDLKSDEAINRECSDDFIWAASGAPFEKATQKYNTRNYKTILTQHMGPWLANRILRHESDDFDYIDMLFEGKPDPGWPNDFSGLSGGGLWHVILYKDPKTNSINLKYLLLSGVAFYQIYRSPQLTIIRCHAEKSTYLKIKELAKEISG